MIICELGRCARCNKHLVHVSRHQRYPVDAFSNPGFAAWDGEEALKTGAPGSANPSPGSEPRNSVQPVLAHRLSADGGSDSSNDFVYLDTDGFTNQEAFNTALENMRHNAISMENLIREHAGHLREMVAIRNVAAQTGPVITGFFRLVGFKELGKGLGYIVQRVQKQLWKDIHDMCNDVTTRTCDDLMNSVACRRALEFERVHADRVMDIFSKMLNTLNETTYMRGAEPSGMQEYLHLQLFSARGILLHAMRKVMGRVTLDEDIAWLGMHGFKGDAVGKKPQWSAHR
jgi:hypothetical protein